jgi:hypothetical protein
MDATSESSEHPRLAALEATALLDTPTERVFDRLTEIAATTLGVPIALISLVTDDRQFFNSQCGLPDPVATTRETPLSHSFCQYVVHDRAPLAQSRAIDTVPVVRPFDVKGHYGRSTRSSTS